ncbi:MAG: hypothetical protein LBB89_12795 [Treponema sp.]|jgi:hypothetical protein|nr:hypothetical protein [Treponema sp.]
MKILVKKIIKAVLPYGIVWLYKKLYERLNVKYFVLFYRKPVKALKKTSANSPQFIITLTSYGKRVNEKAPYAIHSLFNQSIQPDKIVLWLAHGTHVPNKLKKLEKMGLEIRFCDDIRSYKKLIPALREFPDDILITADDDLHYSPDWFIILKEAYLKNMEKIYCHRAHEICLDENKNIIPYTQWRHAVKTIKYSKRLFPTSGAGILYPPHSFNEDIFNVTGFQKLSPTADDVWFWAMALHNGKKYALVKDNINTLIGIGINDDGLSKINTNKNDEQILNVIKAYPDVYQSIL